MALSCYPGSINSKCSSCGVNDDHSKSCHVSIFRAAAVVFIIFSIGSVYVAASRKAMPRWGSVKSTGRRGEACEREWVPTGSESLPEGIVRRTSDLEMQPLYGPPESKKDPKTPKNLLAIPAGIKQKEGVDQIVQKFLTTSPFQVIIFHYDGVVDEWRDLHWFDTALHVSAINQTKWWFAKRFLHPAIVAEYGYIFLWDEDLGIENFHPGRYLKIIQDEGLEISQPALDITKGLRVHYLITARQRRNKFHRRYYKLSGESRCYGNSTGPPCTGWVEMMAPVFSRASWHCVWHMIQNDLIHAWGLDYKLGYCAQGQRSQKIGVVDAEYIVHKGIPTLGGVDIYKSTPDEPPSSKQNSSEMRSTNDDRVNVRLRSAAELEIFQKRWIDAVNDDQCWKDPYREKIQ